MENKLQKIRYKSIGSQAGIFDMRHIGGHVIDLLEKCHEMHEVFKRCTDDLQRECHKAENYEETVISLRIRMGKFNETVDALSVRILQENTGLAQHNVQIDKLRRDIAARKEKLAMLTRCMYVNSVLDKENQLKKMKSERERLQMRLNKVSNDISATYENMYEIEEKFYALKDLRQAKKDEHDREMIRLRAKSANFGARKRELLTLTYQNESNDLSQMYVSPAEFQHLESEIENLTCKKTQVDRHIEMQLAERDFLHETANEILQKVYELERKVRKETGNYSLETNILQETIWHQDVSGPSRVCASRDTECQKYSYRRTVNVADEDADMCGRSAEERVLHVTGL